MVDRPRAGGCAGYVCGGKGAIWDAGAGLACKVTRPSQMMGLAGGRPKVPTQSTVSSNGGLCRSSGLTV